MAETTVLTPDIAAFLNSLHQSGVVNMYSAASHVEGEFDLSERESKIAVFEWMDSL